MLDDFIFAAGITAPIFCIIACGILFKRLGWMTDEFSRLGSDLVFKVTLPCLLFVKLVQTDFRHNLPYALVAYAAVVTLAIFLLLDRIVVMRFKNSFDRGAFVQAVFRGNLGIIGLAFCISAFGVGIVASASIYLAIMTILYNILSVISLSRHRSAAREEASYLRLFMNICKNPLILAIALGVSISLSGLYVPRFFLATGEYFASMTLPLALLCAGASIRMHEFNGSLALYWAVAGKLILLPLLMTLGGILIGLRGEQLGVLYLMSSSPTAAASYPMTQAMGGNHHLVAAAIAATSFGAMIFTTLGIFLLRMLQLI